MDGDATKKLWAQKKSHLASIRSFILEFAGSSDSASYGPREGSEVMNINGGMTNGDSKSLYLVLLPWHPVGSMHSWKILSVL